MNWSTITTIASFSLDFDNGPITSMLISFVVLLVFSRDIVLQLSSYVASYFADI